MKIKSVKTIKITLMLIISAKGVVGLAGINCGRKAMKKLITLDLGYLLGNPLSGYALIFFVF
jgi:hypothetical protein